MVLLGDEAQVEARFGAFGDSANFDARKVHGLWLTYHRIRMFWIHSIEHLGDVSHVEYLSYPFRDSLSIGAR
jgi:hypothetical protein